MVHLPLTEIMMAGIQHLENWLTENGYSCSAPEIWQTGTADIKADSKKENILIQVKTVLHPNDHILLNGTDKFALKDMAERLERIPYVAYLAIDNNRNLVGEIVWQRLMT